MANNFVKISEGVNFGALAYAPLNAKDGDVYYDSTLKTHRFYVDGRWEGVVEQDFDNGTVTDATVTVDLSKGRTQRLIVSPTVPTTTLRVVGGRVGVTYRLKLSFGLLSNFTSALLFDPATIRPLTGSASSLTATPYTFHILKLTCTSAGAQCEVTSYDWASFVHAFEAFSNSDSVCLIRGLTAYGEAFLAGRNDYAQLGLGYASTTDVPQRFESPATILTKSISRIATHSSYVYALEGSTGLLYRWGNSAGQTIPESFYHTRSWRHIVAGDAHYAAIEKSTGFVWTWGAFSNGRLGDGVSTFDRVSPVSVVGGRQFSTVQLGISSSYALEASTGLAWAWGPGANGELGMGNILTNQSSPVSVVGGRSFKQITAGGYFAVALEGSTGLAWAWGAGANGVLGHSLTSNTSSPNSVVGGRSWAKVAALYASVVAIEASTGRAYCWGANTYGELGDGTFVAKSSPVSVLGGRSFNDIKIFGSGSYSIGQVLAYEASTGQIYAWGDVRGQTKYTFSSATPFAVDPQTHGNRYYSQIAVAGGAPGTAASSYALDTTTGTLYTWGYNIPADGNLGRAASNALYPTTPQAVSVVTSFSSIGAGYFATSGVGKVSVAGLEGATGRAYAWGNNESGQLGILSVAPASQPTSVVGARSFRQLVQNGNVTQAIEGATGYLFAWGSNNYGLLGSVTALGAQSSPFSVAGARSYSFVAPVLSVDSAAVINSYALEASTGRAWAWGDNTWGQLGTLTVTPSSSPVSVAGAKSFRTIVGCVTNAAAIEGSTGLIWTWGYGSAGLIGNGSLAHQSSPVSILAGKSFSQLAAAKNAFFAIEASTGVLWGWGYNGSGELGLGHSLMQPVPLALVPNKSWRRLANTGGSGHMAAIDSANVLYYWNTDITGNADFYSSSPISAVRAFPRY